jgi:steroid 5-alpha reductase family enzyme
MLLKLVALAIAMSSAAMTALWLWQRRDPSAGTVSALWPALVAALAIVFATLGDGDWARRSAVGWMMGAWGARLAVHGMSTRAASLADAASMRSFWTFQALAATAVAASTPALLAALNRSPQLSTLELAACALWVIGFTGETTADRQLLRFRSDPSHAGRECRTGLWRYSRAVDRIFEAVIWCAFLMFGVEAIA